MPIAKRLARPLAIWLARTRAYCALTSVWGAQHRAQYLAVRQRRLAARAGAKDRLGLTPRGPHWQSRARWVYFST